MELERRDETMTNEEVYNLLGERAAEISKLPQIQQKMIAIASKSGIEEAERFLYLTAIGTLTGCNADSLQKQEGKNEHE